MRVCVYGTGAIGGFVAARLAAAGHEVAAIARGATLAALRRGGLRLRSPEGDLSVRLRAEADPAAAGPQDLVFVSVKATGLAAVLPRLAPLVGPETPVVVAVNGVPWWFHDAVGLPGGQLRAADPDGALAGILPADRLVACVLHVACSAPEPGQVVHHGQNRFLVGAPDAAAGPRLRAAAALLAAAGVGAEEVDGIATHVWQKLLGNLNFSPVSLLTGAANDLIAGDPALRRLCVAMFDEAAPVGLHFGLDPGMTAEERIDLGGGLAGFKTSMLQDFEAGRPIELEAILGAVRELGDRAGIDTPLLDAVHALAAGACAARAASQS